jgi:hypothetical protein
VCAEVFGQRVKLVSALRNLEDHRARVQRSAGWFRDSFTITTRRLSQKHTPPGDELSLYALLVGMRGVKRYLNGEGANRWTSEQWRHHLGIRPADYPGLDYYRSLADGHLRQLMADLEDKDPGELTRDQLAGFLDDPAYALHRVIAYANKRAAHAGVPDVIMHRVGDLPVDESTRDWYAANPSFDDLVLIQDALEAAAGEVATFYGCAAMVRAFPIPREPLADRAERWLRRHLPRPRHRDRRLGRPLRKLQIV